MSRRACFPAPPGSSTYELPCRCSGVQSRRAGARSDDFSGRVSGPSGPSGHSTGSGRPGTRQASRTWPRARSASGAGSSFGDGVRAELTRPAFYALRAGGWRDYVTLLHVPYTAWHLAYVTIGAALAPEFSVSRLWPTLVAFGLAVGIGAHALDE